MMSLGSIVALWVELSGQCWLAPKGHFYIPNPNTYLIREHSKKHLDGQVCFPGPPFVGVHQSLVFHAAPLVLQKPSLDLGAPVPRKHQCGLKQTDRRLLRNQGTVFGPW